MRYLRKYNLFEGFKSSDSVRDDIKDIFLELVDKGFHVHVPSFPDVPGFINIYGTSRRWEIDSDIIDCLLRLIDYLKMSDLYLNSIYIDYSKPGKFSEHKLVTKVTEEGLFISEITSLGGICRLNQLKVDWPIKKMKIKYSKSNI